MDLWHGFRFHRIVEIPRPDGPDRRERSDAPVPASETGPNATSAALLAALTGAHSQLSATVGVGAMIAAAWVRPPDDPELRLLVGGRPVFPPAGDAGTGLRPVLFPPGAMAVDIDAHAVATLFEAFGAWQVCGGRFDASWADSGDGNRAFEQFVGHMREPFAWLVLAGPLRPDQLAGELEMLVNAAAPLNRNHLSEAQRVDAERNRDRHRELTRFQHGGAWQVQVLAGGLDASRAARAAAMLCAATRLQGMPYVLSPVGEPAALSQAVSAAAADATGGRSWFTASTPLLVELIRPPARELPGVRLVERHTFDVTPEVAAGSGRLTLGAVLDESRVAVGPMTLGLDALNRHAFVCGMTGAGKSQTVRHLLGEATAQGVPWLAVEPAKAEYAWMAARTAVHGSEVIVIRPGDPDAPPAGINPLEPAPGFPLQTHSDLLRALFLAAFEAQEPFPQILSAALSRCYQEAGWDLTLGEPVRAAHRPRYPGLRDLERVAESVVADIGYGPEVAANVRGFIAVRLASLRLGTVGRFFDGGHPIDFERLRSRNVVLELEDVGDDADKAFLMGAVLIRLVEQLRVEARTGAAAPGLTHLTVIEEAHRLLRRPEPGTRGPAAHAVEMFAALLAEVRAYGEGLIVVEQIPSKLIPDVIKNTAVKVVHRLTAADDRDSVGATMNLDADQSRYLVTLAPGEAAVSADGFDRPVLVRVTDGSRGEAAGVGAVTGALSAVIARRSGSCAAACRAEPCTLRHLRSAQHLLDEQPWFVVWAELAVLAHLAGHPMPVPRPESLRTLPAGTRTLDCALSHAVDDAVAVRTVTLPAPVDPAALIGHLCDAVRTVVAGGPDPCRDDDMRYLAQLYRWERARHALAGHRGRDDGPDPRTPEWEAWYGQPIPGRTRAGQLATVTARLATDHRDRVGREVVTLGVRRPATLHQRIGGAGTPGWEPGVRAVLDRFVDCSWPLIHLVPRDRQR